MPEQPRYSIHLDGAFPPLQKIDVAALVAAVKDDWYNQTLCRINDCVVRLGVFKGGEFHWHRHDREDEFFFVLSGRFAVEIEGAETVLGPHQGYTVPRGVLHRTKALEPSHILMIEAATVKPTGD